MDPSPAGRGRVRRPGRRRMLRRPEEKSRASSFEFRASKRHKSISTYFFADLDRDLQNLLARLAGDARLKPVLDGVNEGGELQLQRFVLFDRHLLALDGAVRFPIDQALLVLIVEGKIMRRREDA